MDQLKYVYFISFLFVAGCGIFTLRVLEKTYSQRARMEEQRKDFMNVMAHEIKTPLGVIRGFSENLRENLHSEKRDYYLSQMIRQTEEIDTLVKDMITVTRMDWEQLEIKKTPVSLWEVLDRELERLAVWRRTGSCRETGGFWKRLFTICCPTRQPITGRRAESG